MRIRFGLLLLLLAVPVMGFGQSTLNFPRAFTTSDLGATGFAVVNPGVTSASVTFTLYGLTGTVVATSPQTVPAGGQIARLGTQLFPAATQPGWVQVSSTTTGLQGFWIGGDFATFTDGAASASAAKDIIFPLVAANTEINIANTATSAASVAIKLYGTAGTELASSVTKSISGNGVYKDSASTIFPGANLDDARYVKVEGPTGAAVAGTAVISGFLVTPSWGVTNAVSASSTLTEANFPHVVSGVGGGGSYTTVVGVTNLGTSSQNVTITFTPESGGSPTTVTRTIAASGALRDTAQSLFSFPSGFQNGWVKVTGSASLTAFVAYADSVAGGLAVVPVQATPLPKLLFAHIADLPPWYTGLALLNTTTSPANVEVFAMTPDGALIGGAANVPAARFNIAPGTKTARLLLELVPQTQTRTGDGGFVFIRSSQPLYGIELFFTRSLSILANVAAGNGDGYVPPEVGLPLSVTSLSASSLARGGTLTITGTGFSSTAASNTVVFAGASGTVEAAASASTATSITVTVPATAITGTVSVRTGGQTATASQILQVTLTGSTPVPPNSVTVAASSTASSVDIYVPTPAAGLNATEIGVFDVGATSFSFGASSVEIARGATKELVIDGTGISEARGTTLSISGASSDVTITNVRYQSTLIIVRVTVSVTAATGARNVVLTNSNLDIAVLTGGLFIR